MSEIAVKTRAAWIDRSACGRLWVLGPDRVEFLELVLSAQALWPEE